MNYFPKQLLLDLEDAGEMIVGKEKKKKYIQNQKMRTEEKEIKAAKKRATRIW